MTDLVRDLERPAFPPRNDRVRAQWRPIYIEPMIGSGGRLTIGVAAVTERESRVAEVVAIDKLKCLYGEANEGLVFAARESLRDLRNLLAHGGFGVLSTWQAPFSGITLGDTRVSKGATLDEITVSALRMCSSLPVETPRQAAYEEIDDLAERTGSQQRLLRMVRDYVRGECPGLDRAFSRKIGVGRRQPVIGFFGSRIAANFALLAPLGLSRELPIAKAKILDLQLARERAANLGPQQYELLVYVAGTVTGPLYSDAHREALIESQGILTEEASNVGVVCHYHETIPSIGGRILEKEVA